MRSEPQTPKLLQRDRLSSPKVGGMDNVRKLNCYHVLFFKLAMYYGSLRTALRTASQHQPNTTIFIFLHCAFAFK